MKQLGAVCVLDDFGTLRFSGADVERFLQGQLSNDVSTLSPGALLRAGLHNPQGRTLALLWLIAAGEGDVLAVLPLELLATVAAQLRRYVLRAKLTISDDSAQHRICGLSSLDAAPELPGRRIAYGPRDEPRALLLQSVLEPPPASPAMSRDQWRALDIAAGLAQVYSATSGQFVAQMLNLDCIDAISFTKGCYTGQEVIARAHYRGRVKRRLQAFVSETAAQLARAQAGALYDGRSFKVVDAVQLPDGRCEFLAVAPFLHEPGAGEAPALPASAALLAARQLPLPYSLPA
jgi:folate-binding protein YgfZ